jgi:hypothetical protein
VVFGGSLGAVATAGCAGDDNTSPARDSGTLDHSIPNGSDSGGGSDGNAADGTGTDTGAETGTTNNAIVYVVHGAVDPNAPPLRFCFGLGNPADGGVTVTSLINAFPDTVVSSQFPIPGLFPGFGGSTKSSPQLAQFNLGAVGAISLYALDATKIANDTAAGGPDGGAEVACNGLIGADGLGSAGKGGGSLKMGTDFWYVGTFANTGSEALVPGTAWVAAVTGCLPGEGAGPAALCGPGYSAATGNLALTSWHLDSTTAVTGGIGAQFGNASRAWDAVQAELGAATAAGFWTLVPPADAGADAGDAGVADAGPSLSFKPIASPAPFGSLAPSALVTVPLEYDSTAGFGAAIIGADGGIVFQGATTPCEPGVSCFSPLLNPLPGIDQLSNPVVPSGGSFATGKGYVFILVGNPEAPPYVNPVDGGPATPATGVYNSKSSHFLAFPASN